MKILKFPIQKDFRYIVNAGSIGQPRDGDSRTCFCIFDTDSWTISYIRLDYDISTTQKKIIDAKLPKILADRLVIGY
ncbi:MAG: metallophosphatase family protein [Bacteroidetes bacterium]|nr:metallophosphatase family protein [Bacteroidota bacterium]